MNLFGSSVKFHQGAGEIFKYRKCHIQVQPNIAASRYSKIQAQIISSLPPPVQKKKLRLLVSDFLLNFYRGETISSWPQPELDFPFTDLLWCTFEEMGANPHNYKCVE